ncbi:MAG: SDR family NAD(P)-dependent oxidoreductase [Bacteroidales bacterium]|nr:SDR family NAD(P)-dependent oxidoreductase [Bacteroidales bacterium]MCF8405344.1 SDR family NAD(P)-dependent oxidoreductase [Bacteroidales bacterium]
MADSQRKIALITGATSGIGKACALNLLSKGVEVILTGRRFNGIKKEIVKKIGKKVTFHLIPADLTSDNDLNKLVQKVGTITSQLDILIHSAGIIQLGKIEDSDITFLDKLYAVNLRAPYLLTQKLLPLVIHSKGSIVFINSTAGLNSWGNVGQYAATKHALTAVAKSLRAEVSSRGIKIITVYPGATDTPMQKHIQEMEGNSYDPSLFMPADEVAHIVVDSVTGIAHSVTTDIVIKPLAR